MIFLFTDYGTGPYQGQLEAALRRSLPDLPIINLCADAPPCNPRAAAYLLAACRRALPKNAVLLGVVDPGVGSQQDPPTILRIDRRWYVGPGNGLFDVVRNRARQVEAWHPAWRPERLSDSFHGRDLYAPLAARLARGIHPPDQDRTAPGQGKLPEQLAEIIHLDRFGNALSGIQADSCKVQDRFLAGNRLLHHARTFAEAPPGTPFWHENSSGLVELSVNQGSAAAMLALEPGSPLTHLPHAPRNQPDPPRHPPPR